MKIQLAIIVPALLFGLLMAPVSLCPAQNPFTALEDAAKEKAAEAALTKVLNDNLPLKLDAKDVYPTVTTLPGGPFSPKPLQLTADQLDHPLAPGDYTINTLAFCSEYSVHQPGAGVAYVLGPYEGKAIGLVASDFTNNVSISRVYRTSPLPITRTFHGHSTQNRKGRARRPF